MEWLSARSAFAAFLILFLVMVGFVLFDDDTSLAMNLTTELVGIAITVFLVEKILRESQYRRELPARYAATQEVSLLCREATDLWAHMVHATLSSTTDSNLIEDVRITLLDQRLAAIARRIDLDARAPVSPERRWSDWLFQSTTRMKKQIDGCLTRYPQVLDPQAIRLMQELENSGFFKFVELMPTPRAENARLGSNSLGQLLRNTEGMLSEFSALLGALCDQARGMHHEVGGQVKGEQVSLDFSEEFFQAILEKFRREQNA